MIDFPTAKSNVSIIITDAERRILWVNDTFTTLTGYSLNEVLHKKPSLLQGKNSETKIIEDMRYCLEQKISFKNRITNYKKNGEEYTCSLIVHPIFGTDGRLTNFIAFETEGTSKKFQSELESIAKSTKYRTSSLKKVKSVELYDKLTHVISKDKLYLDSSLNLQKLAEILETNTKYLSQIVNYHYGNNLQQFINQYRVDEAKNKLLDSKYDNLTYFAIGEISGFKNKSTFYKVFKMFTGYTPNEYVQEAKKTSESVVTRDEARL